MDYVFVAWYVALTGTLLVPLMSQWLKTPKMTRKQKFLVVIGASFLSGVVGYPLSGYSFSDITFVIPGVIALSISAYELWWKKVFEESTLAKKLGLKTKKSK